MKFEKQTLTGTIVKRYKRFLVDMELNDKVVTAHLANTGSMKTCWEPGWKVLVSYHDDPKRKLPYSVEMIHNQQTWIGVNTNSANKIVGEALRLKKIKTLEYYEEIQAEYKIGKSRIDFFLSDSRDSIEKQDCYLEVKSVTLKGDNHKALFPDAITQRGQKHLEELIQLKRHGSRAIIFFLIQREDINSFEIAQEIDPEYARLLHKAHKEGVEIFCYQCTLNETGIEISKKIDFTLPNLSQQDEAITQCEKIASQWEFMNGFNPKTPLNLRVQIPSNNHLIFYGGSFNPWHEGHLQCIKLLKEFNKNLSVFIIPDNNPRKKVLKNLNPLQRYNELLKQVPKNTDVYPGFWAKNKTNPTSSWVPEIKNNFPHVMISLLIGFDSFTSIDKWIEAPILLGSLKSLYIVSRQDDEEIKRKQIQNLNEKYPHLELFFLGNHDFETISSTQLRKKKI